MRFCWLVVLAVSCVHDQVTLNAQTTRSDYDVIAACVSVHAPRGDCTDSSWALHKLVATSTGCNLDSDCRVLASEDPLGPPWIAVDASFEKAVSDAIGRVRLACGEVDHWQPQPATRCRSGRCALSSAQPWPKGCYSLAHAVRPSTERDDSCTECSGDGGIFAETDRCTFRCLGGCIDLQCRGDGGVDDVPLVQGIAAPP